MHKNIEYWITGCHYELKRPGFEEDTCVAYYYDNPDAKCRGFGFNIADGGAFLPATDILEDTEVTELILRKVSLEE